MGNYKNLEYEFVERTLHLVSQYESTMYKYDFDERYNHTLLINCLLGLIVMPREKTRTAIPKERLTTEFRKKIGLSYSQIHESITDLQTLIWALRNSVAHFDIKVESHSDDYLIDEIIFNDSLSDRWYEVIRFKADELLPFLQYYGGWLLSNMKTLER